MFCYESVVKNVKDVVHFFTIPLFLAVVDSSIIYFYFILAYMKLTPQQL